MDAREAKKQAIEQRPIDNHRNLQCISDSLNTITDQLDKLCRLIEALPDELR